MCSLTWAVVTGAIWNSTSQIENKSVWEHKYFDKHNLQILSFVHEHLYKQKKNIYLDSSTKHI